MGLSILVNSNIMDRILQIDACPPLAHAISILFNSMLVLVNIYIPPMLETEPGLLNWGESNQFHYLFKK